MEFKAKTTTPEKQPGACLIIPVSQKRKLTSSGKSLDTASGGFLTKILRSGDMDGRCGHSLMLHNVPGIQAERVLLVGSGKDSDMNERNFARVVKGVSSALDNSAASDACSYLTDIPLKQRDTAWKVRQSVLLVWHSR